MRKMYVISYRRYCTQSHDTPTRHTHLGSVPAVYLRRLERRPARMSRSYRSTKRKVRSKPCHCAARTPQTQPPMMADGPFCPSSRTAYTHRPPKTDDGTMIKTGRECVPLPLPGPCLHTHHAMTARTRSQFSVLGADRPWRASILARQHASRCARSRGKIAGR